MKKCQVQTPEEFERSIAVWMDLAFDRFLASLGSWHGEDVPALRQAFNAGTVATIELIGPSAAVICKLGEI